MRVNVQADVVNLRNRLGDPALRAVIDKTYEPQLVEARQKLAAAEARIAGAVVLAAFMPRSFLSLRAYPSRAACSQAMMPQANWSMAS
jgi:hypothetical protein